jgi:H+/Cl- antiporter ClcA
MLKVLRLVALMSVGAVVGHFLIDVVYDTRDGKPYTIPEQFHGLVLGSLFGLLGELLIRRLTLPEFRFSLKEALLAVALIAIAIWIRIAAGRF